MHTMTKAKSSVRFHVILTVAEYNALSAESERTGAPMGELVRRALRIAEVLPRKSARPHASASPHSNRK